MERGIRRNTPGERQTQRESKRKGRKIEGDRSKGEGKLNEGEGVKRRRRGRERRLTEIAFVPISLWSIPLLLSYPIVFISQLLFCPSVCPYYILQQNASIYTFNILTRTCCNTCISLLTG